MRTAFTLLSLLLTLTVTAQSVIITGLTDPTVAGATPRVIELYVNGSVDLSAYSLERYANANTNNVSADLSGTYTNEFVYLINRNQADDFTAAFGDQGDFNNRIEVNIVTGNGNDAFVLRRGDELIDQTGGEIGETTNLYKDSYLYRVDGTGPDGGWEADNWLNVGENGSLSGVEITGLAAAVPFGTYTSSDAGPSISVNSVGYLAEPDTNGAFTIVLSEPAANDVTVTYDISGTATAGLDYVAPTESVVIPAGQTSVEIIIAVIDDNEAEAPETVVLTLISSTDATYSVGGSAELEVLDNEPAAALRIGTIQGPGYTSPFVGQTVTIGGIVTGDFQGPEGVGLGGFFVQEEAEDVDDNPLTSEGIWVFQGDDGVEVAPGDEVIVTGVVAENFDLTEIDVTAESGLVTVSSSGNDLPAVTEFDLSSPDAAAYEALEGMRIEFRDEVVVTSNFGLARYGEFEITEGERIAIFTECNEPDVTTYEEYVARLEGRTLAVDDGRSGNNVYPILLPDGSNLTPDNTFRAGTRISGLTGVVDERFNGYRLQLTSVQSISENERPAGAPNVGGNITVVSMNILNYFTTLESRGADDQEEFERQEAKIVAAICELDAAVLGLVEIENNGTGAGSATQALIDAIAAGCGKQYTAVVAPETGTDEIKVQLIYDAAKVGTLGQAASLEFSMDIQRGNRVPVAQTFQVIAQDSDGFGGQFTVCVNHLRSKGGSCGDGNDDLGGAGGCNGHRVQAAQEIRDWLDSDPTGTGVTQQLIMGDLNTYTEEEPINVFEDAGFVNLIPEFNDEDSFPCGGDASFVYRGAWGSLDHALASGSLLSEVTGVDAWNVNAAEPSALDYDTRYNNPDLYSPDYYRFSDHDPIVVGLSLTNSLPAVLSSFTGEEVAGQAELSWTTTSEIEVTSFLVERQNEDGSYSPIGSISAAGVDGNGANYSLVDAQPEQGANIYRLTIVGEDGENVATQLINVQVDNPNGISLARIGAQSYQLADAPVGTNYVLTTAAGAVIRSGRVTAHTQEIDGHRLPAGIYFLGLQLPNGQRQAFKLHFTR